MNRRRVFLLFLYLALFFASRVSFAQTSDELEFNVDLSSPAITLPKIYKPSIDLSGRGIHRDITWPQTLAAKGILEVWQAELGFNNLYRMQYNLWEIEQLAKDKNAMEKLLDSYETVIKKISDSGGVIILDLFGTPSGLGRVLDKNSAVHNLEAYKQLVKDTIYQLSCKKKYNIWYEVWNAPDLGDFFLGERSEYLNLYRIVGEAVKELEQETKIHIPLGGPSTSCWFADTQPNDILTPEGSLIYELIKYCYSYKLPLDFISWHAYSSDPKLEKQLSIYNKPFIKLIREWLSYFHFESNLPLVIDEWNFDAVANISPKRGKQAYIAASYIPARLKNMQDAGLDYQTYFCLEDFGGNKEGISRNLGVFSFDGQEHSDYKGSAKASYNTFRMLNLLGNELLPVSVTDEFVGVIATKSQDYLAVLVYNYIDPQAALDYLSRQIVDLNSAERKQIINIVKSDRIEKILSGQSDLSVLRLPAKAKNMLSYAIELNNLAKKFSATERKIKISFKGIKDVYLRSRYVVDNNCSRDCAFKADDEQEVDFSQEHAEGMELTPYSVQLLVFKKKPLPVPAVEAKPDTNISEDPLKNAENK
ncbi:MAG: hypothetical protein PHT50_01690 [Candidatus Omnitrophica bacterium]|nr:hypothetical protein [Candidatus Omnitrophota bacterium]